MLLLSFEPKKVHTKYPFFMLGENLRGKTLSFFLRAKILEKLVCDESLKFCSPFLSWSTFSNALFFAVLFSLLHSISCGAVKKVICILQQSRVNKLFD